MRSPCWLQEVKQANLRGDQRWNVELRCLPAVLLPGMPKCGSSTLYQQLKQHPDLLGGKKEPHYWAWNFKSESSLLNVTQIMHTALLCCANATLEITSTSPRGQWVKLNSHFYVQFSHKLENSSTFRAARLSRVCGGERC